MHLKRKSVAVGVLAGQGGIVWLNLQPRKVKTGHPPAKAKGCCPRPAAKVKHTVAGLGRAGGGQQDRIGRRAVAFQRLEQAQATA